MDQLQYWNNAHTHRRLRDYSHAQTSFAEEVNTTLIEPIELLELGCGEGNDSLFFAAGDELIYGRRSAFIKVVAHKPTNDAA